MSSNLQSAVASTRRASVRNLDDLYLPFGSSYSGLLQWSRRTLTSACRSKNVFDDSVDSDEFYMQQPGGTWTLLTSSGGVRGSSIGDKAG